MLDEAQGENLADNPSVPTEEVKETVEATTETEASERSNEEVEDNADTKEAEPEQPTVEDLQKQIEEQNQKIARQKAANAAKQREYEEVLKKVKELETLKPLVEPKESDFETSQEYEDAMAEHKADIKYREKEAERLQEQEQVSRQEALKTARATFEEKQAEVAKANSDYAEAQTVVGEYLNLIPEGDAGGQMFSKYIAFEADNGPALIHHLGNNPDKIEALLGKPPAFIKRKLASYEKEIAHKPPPEEPKTKPAPPTPVKGGSKHKKDPMKMSKVEFKKQYNL